MIRHIVMWNVRGATPDERQMNIGRIRSAFLGLRGRIPGMLDVQVGTDVSGADYACDVVLVADFDGEKALQRYASHPEHLRVRDELTGLRIERHQVDYAVAAAVRV